MIVFQSDFYSQAIYLYKSERKRKYLIFSKYFTLRENKKFNFNFNHIKEYYKNFLICAIDDRVDLKTYPIIVSSHSKDLSFNERQLSIKTQN